MSFKHLQKNATADGTLEAKTGLKNRNDLGQIVKFNGKDKLPWWSGDKCNELKSVLSIFCICLFFHIDSLSIFRGTDGFAYPPNLSKSDKIYVFNRDLCRSIPLEFSEEIKDANDIPGYRFVPPANLFGTPQENPDNACFCNNPNGICDTPSGVFNVSACQYGSPTLLSWPHFFQAEQSLRDAVKGMKPNKDKHQFYIDVQPVRQLNQFFPISFT